MKSVLVISSCLLLQTAICLNVYPQSLTASELVRRADEKFNGEKSVTSTMIMTIVRPAWERSISFKNWSAGRENSLTLITAPARDQGQTFLKKGYEMWNWNPVINRIIKLPPSMLSQGWMGSDYTNDDILKESSAVNDYTHEFDGEELIDGRECYRIKMTAKPESGVIWGHQVRWIDKKDLLILKTELYDDEGILVRTERGSEIKMMDGRLIPSVLELLPADEKGNKTIVRIVDIKFNIPVDDTFFSQQNMKRVR
jgi:outer membrane lipoprotein-sorting protein